MRLTEHGWLGVAFRCLAGLGLLYMLAPILLMFPLSVEDGHILRFPPEKLSLHWYSDYFASEAWLDSTGLSVMVALGAALVSTTVGTIAAIGAARASVRMRSLCSLILTSPILLPTIVAAVSMYGVYASLRLVGTTMGLIAAHAVLTLPFVVLNVSAAIAAAPRSLEEAAMSLGATPLATLLQVTIPLLSKGIAAGAAFAFLVSFDEVVIAKFLGSAETVTLPKRMFDGVFYEMTPMLAAVSCMLVLLNVAIAAAALAFTRSR
jgi:ABC-type spermidine/putrescine transport system permease subunit II